jgi:translation initiation factor IF-3
MSSITPNPKKRGYLLPPGCKDLIDVLEGRPLKKFLGEKFRVNGKIHAVSVRVIGDDGKPLGIMPRAEALRLAQSRGLDLVEIAPSANPPICRLIDFGKFRFELSKRRKKHA